MEGLSRVDDPQIISLAALRELGRAYLVTHPDLVDQRLATRGAKDLAVLVYTSGTTGRPRAR